MTSIFGEYIERDLERVPLLETLHTEQGNGSERLISHVVVKNVFTDFDRQLSRLLAAVRGGGFPGYTVFIRTRERNANGQWRDLEPTQHVSVPHALRAIAERAVSSGDGKGIVHRTIRNGAASAEGDTPVPVGRAYVSTLTAALKLCETIGEPEFLDISGDFDAVVCRPSAEQRPLTVYLRRGSVTIPNGRADDSGVSEHPIAGFRATMDENVCIQTYVSTARHALAATKEAAVSEFRSAAEAQIMAFDRALRGRPLEGFLMDSAMSLIARLKAGLGEELRGLSQYARITALDWSTAAGSARRLEEPKLPASAGFAM